MPPHYRLKQLGELVSGAGMRYLSKYLLLEDPRRNEMVLNALEQSGVEISKHAVDDQLALVVRVARAHLAPYIAAYSRPDSLADFTEAIQGDPSLPRWAAGLSGSAFFELFWRLVQARGQWWACPAPPFDPKDQSPVAAEVQAFVAAVPGFYAYEWLESEATTWRTVGGMDSDDDDDDDEEDDDHKMEMPRLHAVVKGMAKDGEDNQAGGEMMDLS